MGQRLRLTLSLRESILVLQEQLQERETRIEQMQQQLKHEGPAKLKERDTEIAWLRELLAVRSEELTDLVNTLSKPTFDRDNVRDIDEIVVGDEVTFVVVVVVVVVVERDGKSASGEGRKDQGGAHSGRVMLVCSG